MTCMMHTNSTSKVWSFKLLTSVIVSIVSSFPHTYIAPRCPGVIFNHFTVEDGQSTLQDLHAIMKSELFDCLRSNDQPPSSRWDPHFCHSESVFPVPKKNNSAGSSIYPIVRLWPPRLTNQQTYLFFTESAVLSNCHLHNRSGPQVLVFRGFSLTQVVSLEIIMVACSQVTA